MNLSDSQWEGAFEKYDVLILNSDIRNLTEVGKPHTTSHFILVGKTSFFIQFWNNSHKFGASNSASSAEVNLYQPENMCPWADAKQNPFCRVKSVKSFSFLMQLSKSIRI